MCEFVLEAEERTEYGKNANRRLRAKGLIPAVVYGPKTETASLVVDPEEVSAILHSGRNTIFKLKFKKKMADVLVRDFQLHPLRGNLLHADFQSVALDELMEFQVSVEAIGTPKGVKEGGLLDIPLREVEVECLPGDVPDHISVDVSELEIGDAIRISDLQINPKVKVLSDPDLVILTVVPPRIVEEETEEEEVSTLEPELIGRAKEEEGEEED